MGNCGLRDDELIKTGFHYQIGDCTWYRQHAEHWIEQSSGAYVRRFETWLLVEQDYSETDVGEAGIKAALRYATEVLARKRAAHETALDARIRKARRNYA